MQRARRQVTRISATANAVCSLAHTARKRVLGLCVERCRRARCAAQRQPSTRSDACLRAAYVTSLVAFPAALLAFLTALLLPIGFLRRSLALRPFVLTMWLLLTLHRSLRLLPLNLA